MQTAELIIVPFLALFLPRLQQFDCESLASTRLVNRFMMRLAEKDEILKGIDQRRWIIWNIALFTCHI
ncbi:hypothetical protein DV36_47925 [Amycolatopsis mediterranei]|uniref:Uncharacterized protein n=1 Tax=Amycolatopsis mediterranei (strain S699) TaxID=713604 RepID=A0A9R0P192_AMYMS|nr:hypothetical protein RAM_29860 [Amycolatopsis mediterranei S699]KDU84977.1 hypothetical protein DV36_47925 [Amycolatopsis mediterranei]